jgi:hypothetical protein
VREEPTDELCKLLGHGLGRQARSVDDFEVERIRLLAKMRSPRGHLVGRQLRLSAPAPQPIVLFKAFAIEKNSMNAAVHSSGCVGNERWSSLPVEHGDLNCRVELIKLVQPVCGCPCLPFLSAAMGPEHLFGSRDANRIEVEAAHAGESPFCKRANARGLTDSRSAGDNQDVQDALPHRVGRSPPNAC